MTGIRQKALEIAWKTNGGSALRALIRNYWTLEECREYIAQYEKDPAGLFEFTIQKFGVF